MKKQVFRVIQNSFIVMIISITALLTTSISTYSLPLTFDREEIITDEDFYNLPSFWSVGQTDQEAIAQIQAILEYDDSILATEIIDVSFKEDWNDDEVFYAQKPGLIPYAHTTTQMGTAELIWKLSRTDMGMGCGIIGGRYQDICLEDNINPLFLLALIQKESGLIYGRCANRERSEINNCQDIDFRMDRATGYYCFETSDHGKSCYDENPMWAYYKGFFRQVYFASNMFRFRERACNIGGPYTTYLSGGAFATGETVIIDGQAITLNNGWTCANYIYTPHISSTTYRVMWDLYGLMEVLYPAQVALGSPVSSIELDITTNIEINTPTENTNPGIEKIELEDYKGFEHNRGKITIDEIEKIY